MEVYTGMLIDYLESSWPQLKQLILRIDLEILLGTLLTISIITGLIIWRCLKSSSKFKAVKELIVPPEGPRFRKREKIAFITSKFSRKAKSLGSYIKGGQGRKRKDMAKLVKRLFQQGQNANNGSSSLCALGKNQDHHHCIWAKGGRYQSGQVC